ncbi:ABC transporter permease [Spiroplasma endosymbiont of Aspidapion aeneum]|uniref:ABC transporter permease n=1 Tax=Spiroplasma endosymbiont of Aspidapion aeneum TaxID=3066276 RepID=UPI00313AD921
MDLSTSIIRDLLMYFTIFSICAVAGMFSERSGIINMGLDGYMVIGALIYSIYGSKFNHSTFGQITGIFVALIFVGIFSLLHSFATIKLNCDHIIAGIAINIFGEAIGLFVATLPKFQGTFIASKYKPFYLDSQNVISLYLFISIIVSCAVGLYFTFTKVGRKHIAAGENPNALDVVGVSVNKYRFIAVTISSMMAGFAGIAYCILKGSGSYFGSVNGYGYIALAIMVAGQWRTIYCLLFSAIFSATFAIVPFLTSYQAFSGLKNYEELLNAIPFAISLMVMVFVSKKSSPPKASGQPFIKIRR